jgi:CubicO group peptidase (beta-lactamase class C family)
MKRYLCLFTLLFVVVQSFVWTAAAADKALYEEAIHTARREIWKTLSSGQASSATVAFMDDGKIVYSEGFGMRDREKGLPVEKNTQFNIGSISKIFTAAAILLLVDDGRVKLDEPVTTYLPNFTTQDERYKNITVRMLLNHTSGLPGTNPKDGFGSQKNPNYTAETLSYLAAEGIKHTPGQISVYCNDGFTVAEAVVEAASEMSYADFLKKRIFKPMMMRNSSCFFKDGNTNIALAYSPNTGLAMPVEYVSIMGSGGISSTPEDLCRYSTVLYKNRLFSENSLSEYTRAQYGPETVPDGGTPAFNCGLGWDSVAVNKFANQGVTVLAKNGGTQEFSSQLYVAPKEKLSIALIFTGAGVDTMTVTSTIMQTLLEEKGIVPHDGGPKLPSADAVIPAQLLTYAGFYASNSSIYKVAFDQSSNTMKLFSFAGSAFSLSKTLQYKSDGFFYSDTGGRIFLENRKQTNYLLTFQGSDTTGGVFAEGVSPGATGIDASAFAGKQWLFRNASNYDFTVGAGETGTVAELPGYVYLRNENNYMLAQLQFSDRAGMCLKYARDILGLSVVANNGQNWLELGRFLYSESQGISALTDGESVVIGVQGLNEWRQSQNQAILDCSIPSSGRIIVLTGDLQPRYDSLTAGSPPPLIVNAGDYVSFIGKTGDAFPVKLSGQ